MTIRQKSIIVILFFALTLILHKFILLPPREPDLFLDYQTINTKIGNKVYTLYIADTNNKQEQGLSGVKKMDKNVGMLFKFERPDKYNFWMKDMNFSLDFVYLNDNTVVGLSQSISPQTYPRTFTAKNIFDAVIELNSGEIDKSEVKLNDAIVF